MLLERVSRMVSVRASGLEALIPAEFSLIAVEPPHKLACRIAIVRT